MNTKWYLSTLFIILALLGISLEETTTPNQEIVVQFSKDEVTFDEARNAIAIVKEQLQTIGVENIRVVESADGKLKITYYSEVDVASIKEILSKGEKLEFGYTSYTGHEELPEFPPYKDFNSYKLNVSEIQNSPDLASDYNGYLIQLEAKTVSHRHFDADVYFSDDEIDLREINRIEKIAYQVHSNNALLIDNSSHNIPEVRAGPLA